MSDNLSNAPAPLPGKDSVRRAAKSSGAASLVKWFAGAVGELYVGSFWLKFGGTIMAAAASVLQAVFAVDGGIPWWIAIMYAVITFTFLTALVLVIFSRRKPQPESQQTDAALPSQQQTQTVTASPVINNTLYVGAGADAPAKREEKRGEPKQPLAQPYIDYRGFRTPKVPFDIDDNTLGDEHMADVYVRERERVVRTLLVRFYYRPDADVPHWIQVKPHVFFEGVRDVYDAIWYRTNDEYQTFHTGKAYELVVALLMPNRNDVLIAYEYDRKPIENTFGQRDFFMPNIYTMEGKEFRVLIELVCKWSGEVIAKWPFRFRLTLEPEPRLEAVTANQELAASGDESKPKINKEQIREELLPLLREGQQLKSSMVGQPIQGDWRFKHQDWVNRVDRFLLMYLGQDAVTNFHWGSSDEYSLFDLDKQIVELEKVVRNLAD